MRYFLAIVLSLTSSSVWAQKLAKSVADQKVLRTIAIPAKDPWDLDIHTGGGFGSFINKNNVSKNFGGILVGTTLYSETIFEKQTAFASADFLIDADNQQVIRKGLGLGVQWPLVGGKKRQIERLKPGIIASQNRFTLSWANRLSYDSFSVTPKELGIEKLEGSNVSLLTGLGLNLFIGDQSSVALTLMNTVLSFSASIENSTQTSTELGLAIRTYL